MIEEWILENLPTAIGGALVAILSILQVSPIKFNPWSALAGWIGGAINREMAAEVGKLRETLTNHIVKDDERYAKNCRLRILRFNDELLQQKMHTKEHFDEILDDITEYERYCREHPDYKNNKAVLAIQNVEHVYQDCLAKNNFL